MKPAPHYREGIDRRRQELKLTVRQLADAADLSPTSISSILNGRTRPTARSIHRLAAALQMPAEAIAKEVAK